MKRERGKCESCGKLTTRQLDGPEPPHFECKACAWDYEAWENVMADIFQHGGSDSEREVFGKYFGRGR